MQVPIEIIVMLLAGAMGYMTWNFNAVTKIIANQNRNNIRLHSIEVELGIADVTNLEDN